MNTTAFCEALNERNINFRENEIMANHTTFKIGGSADFFVEPKNIDEIKLVLNLCKKHEIPYFVLGNGSNLLVSDLGIEGAVISLTELNEVKLDNAIEITAFAGAKLSKLCLTALENQLSGFEFAWGIPGTVGGAVYMNAGAYGSDISAVIKECTYIDENGNVVQADVSSLQLGYRKSIFSETDKIIISAKFRLSPERRENIKAQMDELLSRRREKQPLEYASAGSTFKRPTGNFAGALIEKCNLKGATVGGAQVSEKHAGFVINIGGATCHDVILLMEKIKETVFLETSIMLEPEVKVIGKR